MRTIVAACSEQTRAIGLNGTLPWKCPADLKLLRAAIAGRRCVCGPATYAGLPLSIREQTTMIHRTDKLPDNVVILGGEALFEYAIENELWDDLYLTVIQGSHEGDRFFPRLDMRNYHRQAIPFPGCTLFYLNRHLPPGAQCPQ